MSLSKYLQDEKLKSTLEKNVIEGIAQLSVTEQFNKWNELADASHFIVPVLGVQGAGKSSLLNALLMDDIIIPLDANETTCIPTEIVYTEIEDEKAGVLFENGEIKKIPCNEDELKQYVNNDFNPANKKKVDFVRINKNDEVLKNKIILVDLPGVGSLTPENVETTMDYILKSTGAILLLRTTPPITQSESVFIQSIMPMLSKIFYIQNQWTDENNNAAEEGKEYNLKVLKKLAEESGKETKIDIDVINVYNAVNAKVKDDIEKLKQSGLSKFKEKFLKYSGDWQTQNKETIQQNLLNMIGKAISFILEQMDLLNKDKDEINTELDKKREEFAEEYQVNEQKIESLTQRITEERKPTLTELIEIEVKTAKGNFRNNMRQVIGSGVTDGNDLQKAFKDNQIEQADIVFTNIMPHIQDLVIEIQNEVDDIQGFSFERANGDFEGAPDIDHKKRWETPLKPVLQAGGALGGGVLGVWGTAKLGAAIGTTFGPAGTAVGAAIGGVVGSVVAWWTSNKVAESVRIARGKEAKKVVFKLIEEWREKTENDFLSQLNSLCNEIPNNLDEWLKEKEGEFNSREKELKSNLELNLKEKEEKVGELKIDQQVLGDYLTEIRGNK